LNLALGEELASLGAAQIDEMQRGLKRDDGLNQHGEQLRSLSSTLARIAQQVAGSEAHAQQAQQRQDQLECVQRDQLELAASSAAALIDLQTLFSKGVLQ
ncbi:hypothetical protein PWG14_15525, partial (plasmid) [Chromobacterium amazonense]|nr:hypothetical protein [Chromobacterium amazonense]